MTVLVWPLIMERQKADYDREYAAWKKRQRPAWLTWIGCGPMTFDAFNPPIPKPLEWFMPTPMAFGDLFGPYPSPRDPREPIDRMTEGDLYA